MIRAEFRPEKLSRRVLRDLTRRIANGELVDGQPPTEQEICEQYGVSKTVAREVVGQLQGMGLIEVRHGRRMQVRDRDRWNYLDPLLVEALEDRDEVHRLLSELHELRLLIEPATAANAARRATPERLRHLDELTRAMSASIDDPDQYLELDAEFHAMLLDSVGNRILSQLLGSVGALLQVSRRATNLLPNALERATQEHRAILDAVSEGDGDGARRAMERHLEWGPAAWSDLVPHAATSGSE